MDLVVAVKSLDSRRRRGTDGIPAGVEHRPFDRCRSLLDWNDEKGKLFEIVIQFAAILAVCWLYGSGCGKWLQRFRATRSRSASRESGAGVLARRGARVIFINTIKKYLFAPVPVATAFIIGGILILWIESRKQSARIGSVDDIQRPDAIWIGFAQALSMIPGTSRSGATIMGGLLRGLSRPAATEFSFSWRFRPYWVQPCWNCSKRGTRLNSTISRSSASARSRHS